MPPGRAASAERLVAVIVPTLSTRHTDDAIEGTLKLLGVAMSLMVSGATVPTRCHLIVAMQGMGPGDWTAIVGRLHRLEDWWQAHYKLPFLGIALDRPSKVLALNATIPALDAMGASVIAWFDDDIQVDALCLSRLLAEYDENHPGIYGARKVAIADESDFSSRWAARKNSIEPINAYPHGCAALMSRREFHMGIPQEYQSDDNYYLLRYLEPTAPDPFWRLVVVADAIVRVPSTNDARSTARRIARNFRNGIRILADAPWSTVRFFLWSVLFCGLRRPRRLAEVAAKSYWSLAGWHTLKLLFWSALGASVLLRGIFRRPFSPTWYSAPFPRVASSGGVSARPPSPSRVQT
jgi:hypothetical protein